MEEANVATLRAERALALGSAALAAQRAAEEMTQLAQEQQDADADSAAELEAAEEAAEAAEEAAALQQVAAQLEHERQGARDFLEMESFGAHVLHELRSEWRVWLLACAYAGRLHGGMTVVEARAVAEAAKAAARPVLSWGGIHGWYLYDLARSTHGRRLSGPRDAQMLRLLDQCGLRETCFWLSSGCTSKHRSTVEHHVTAKFETHKVSTM